MAAIKHAFGLMRDVAATYLFASVPQPYRPAFREKQYFENIRRFATMSFVLAWMDIFSLVVYSIYYHRHSLSAQGMPHLAFHLLKIIVMAALFLRYSNQQGKAYNTKYAIVRNSDVLYPALHGLLEFWLFFLGPRDLGALIRFMAVPFIMGSIPIIGQLRIALLNIVYFSASSVLLVGFSNYQSHISAPSYLFNVCFVVLICAVLVSNIIYSSFVNSYLRGRREAETQQELMLLNSKLDIISRKDQLTGLSNRRDFDQFMELSWAEERKKGGTLTMMMMDIDYFKMYNDRFGHVAGDEVLARVAKTISSEVNPAGHICARYGGEEFIVAAYNESHSAMVHMADAIRRHVQNLKIENPDSVAGPYLTISIGVATRQTADLRGYQPLVTIADECLYFAKQQGRNRVVQLGPGGRKYLDAHNQPIETAVDMSPDAAPMGDTEHLLQALVNTSLDCTFLYSRHHGTLEFSAVARELLKMPSSIVAPTLDKVFNMIPVASEDRSALQAHFRKDLDNQERQINYETRLNLGNGQKSWVALRMKCMYGQNGVLEAAAGSFYQIQTVLDYSNYMLEKAMVDSVTLLPNRNRFYKDMRKALKTEGQGLLVLFDISAFKSINGIFSHNIGDKVLGKAGEMLQRMTVEEGKTYHYTIDQFLLLLPGAGWEQGAATVDRVCRFFASHDIDIDGTLIKISFSVGAVQYGVNGENLDDLMVNLDIALQKAKLEHVPGLRPFSEEDRTEYIASVSMEKDLVHAIQSNFRGFVLHYQPIFGTQNEQCLGAEALLRWQAPSGELISPLEVVPVLEKSGLMPLAGPWILRQACMQCRRWINEGAGQDFYIHVNISLSQIDRMSFVSDIYEMLEANGLRERNLVLEVTESSFVSDSSQTINILRTLRTEGVRIAVDDFGTGYSSLSYLRTMPADIIKIDKSFLEDIEYDDSARRILQSVVELTRGMGFEVCAEGAETEGQLRILRTMPIDTIQGFYLGPPVKASAFYNEWLLPWESLAEEGIEGP